VPRPPRVAARSPKGHSKNDVGEIRRVLNSFLQFLVQDDSDSLVLGATNHVGLLDRALFRRFDAVLEYALPTAEIAARVMRARLGLLGTSAIDWGAAAKAAEGLSHAEVAMACEQAAKNAILDHSTSVRDSELALAVALGHASTSDRRLHRVGGSRGRLDPKRWIGPETRTLLTQSAESVRLRSS